MDEVEFAKFPDEFNVAKHLDLGNGTLLLLLRSERVVMFVIDWRRDKNGKESEGRALSTRPSSGLSLQLTFNISGAVLKFILKFGNQQSSEGLQEGTQSQRQLVEAADESLVSFYVAVQIKGVDGFTYCALLLGCLDLGWRAIKVWCVLCQAQT